MPPKTVVVVGATGLQFLKYPNEYRVRGLTRNISKPAALALSAKGVDIQAADLDDGHEALEQVFAGANIIFALTDFWASRSKVVEVAQGKALADAAARIPTLEHFVWSALPDPMELSRGRLYHVHHWKSKADVTEYIRTQKPELWKKTTMILFPNYFENCLTDPKRYLPRQVSGILVREFPLSADTILPNVAIADTGKLVRAVVEDKATYFEKTIAFWAEGLSEGEKLARLGSELGIPVEYRKSTPEQFQKGLEEAGLTAEISLDFTEQLLMFEYFGNVYASHDFVQAREIPQLSLRTWDDFVREHKDELMAKIGSGDGRSQW
ncbi:NAD(P)-binding protein [Trichoderma longibrachiatum ATCC 18648]|uniref:NAD(P)-binding protein n=1 Tax=Trichoderma longibrachiatum ATCC 18648 TaxID=983965 RepID=A0A2T4BQW3_TRILO|nr:NAD(P)-binding protein [Trichoderma longibrachiatum ATCC 18648]